jgi:hypothetical protein
MIPLSHQYKPLKRKALTVFLFGQQFCYLFAEETPCRLNLFLIPMTAAGHCGSDIRTPYDCCMVFTFLFKGPRKKSKAAGSTGTERQKMPKQAIESRSLIFK